MITFRKATAADVEWFTRQTGYRPSPEFRGIVAETPEIPIGGMIGMDFWTPRSVQMHIALETISVLPDLWREAVDFLKHNGRELVYGVTPSNNDLSIRLQHACGFQEVHRMKDAWDHGIDMVIQERRI